MSPGPAKQFNRENVLARAMDCFWSKGYEGAGMAELLGEMGIGRQSLYDTFGDKRSLFLEALQSYADENSRSIIGALEGPGTALENLTGFMKFLRTFVLEGDGRGCLLINVAAEFGGGDPEVTQIMSGCQKRVEDAFVRTLDQAKKDGDLDKKLPSREMARLFISSAHGLILRGKVRKDPAYVDSVLGALKRVLGAR